MIDSNKLERADGLYKAGQLSEAARLYEEIADGGHAESQVFVGWLYSEAVGVKRDDKMSEYWFSRAAQGGSPKGMFFCGRMHTAKGDQVSAFQWYTKSASAGFAPAHFRLGESYRRGQGIERDVTRAEQHYRIAAAAGHIFAKRALGLSCLSGRRGLLLVIPGAIFTVLAVLQGLFVLCVDRYSENLVA